VFLRLLLLLPELLSKTSDLVSRGLFQMSSQWFRDRLLSCRDILLLLPLFRLAEPPFQNVAAGPFSQERSRDVPLGLPFKVSENLRATEAFPICPFNVN
jgi:hypothetical protein